MGLAVFGGASSAWAGTALSVPPDIPDPNGGVAVGQTNLPASLTIQNGSTQAQSSQTVTASNITIVPSCGTLVISADCPVASLDPGVFRLSATGTGRAGTACANQVFTTMKIDSAMDKYRFVPFSPATNPVLQRSDQGGPLSRCVINFTVDVLKVPTRDARPEGGIQTGELGGADAISSDTVVGGGVGTNFTTVSPATIPIRTDVAPTTPITLGSTFHDTATLTPNPGATPPTGSITFDVYGNSGCTGSPTFSSTNALNASGTSATSDDFRPANAGTYYVIARYPGDRNYNALTTACGDPTEIAVVTRAPLPIVTQVTPTSGTIQLGGTFFDTATLGPKPTGAADPTGSVRFDVYDNQTCTGTPRFTS
ncbi:MAG: hypothetical protein QOI42_640, partial [Frankiaceae bacterium]|nr:hypothetical protein [Frankiaceae bacterium]